MKTADPILLPTDILLYTTGYRSDMYAQKKEIIFLILVRLHP